MKLQRYAVQILADKGEAGNVCLAGEVAALEAENKKLKVEVVRLKADARLAVVPMSFRLTIEWVLQDMAYADPQLCYRKISTWTAKLQSLLAAVPSPDTEKTK